MPLAIGLPQKVRPADAAVVIEKESTIREG